VQTTGLILWASVVCNYGQSLISFDLVNGLGNYNEKIKMGHLVLDGPNMFQGYMYFAIPLFRFL